jgi:hypothetical protein
MLGPGDHVDPDIRRQIGVGSAGRVGVDQRGTLLPVLGRAVGLDYQRVGRMAPEDSSGLARERVGRDRIAKREPVLGIEPVLVLGGGAPRHAEAVVGEHLARTRDVAHDPVEDALPARVPGFRGCCESPNFDKTADRATAGAAYCRLLRCSPADFDVGSDRRWGPADDPTNPQRGSQHAGGIETRLLK